PLSRRCTTHSCITIFIHYHRAPRDLPSFPTRRSSDLCTDTRDPARGALLQKIEERGTAIGTDLLFFGLEWANAPDDHVAKVLERSEEHTSELQSRSDLVCRLLLEKKKRHSASVTPPLH